MSKIDNKVSISLIIPVYNGGESFGRCLAAIESSSFSPLEIIVVADGDTDGSRKVAEDFGAKVLQNSTSKGPATARNQGAAIATGDILFFVDADVTIYPDTLAKVALVFQSHPDVAALIGSYDTQPGALNFLSQYKNLFHHYIHQISSPEASSFWGACGGIRREIFIAMGGFDQSYRHPSIEDIELGHRLKAAGYNIRLCKEIQVKHLKHWTPYSLLRADFYYRGLPWTELIQRRGYLPNDLNLQWSSRLSVVLVYGILGGFLGAIWFHSLFLLSLILIVILFSLNAPVYSFFLKQRGLFFTLKTIPWHWFYYLYSGLAFAWGTVRHWFFSHFKFAFSQTRFL